MVIDLHSVYDNEGGSFEFEGEISSERLSEIKGYSFKLPAAVKGVVQNRAGVVTLDYHVRAVLDAECGRCLSRFDHELSFDCGYTLVRELSSGENDDYAVTSEDKLDVDELAMTDIILQMPSKLLCKEDCKGLCPRCGADLNVSDCGCNDGS